MQCDKCKNNIKENEARNFYGQILCEDCYIDTLSPAKACDPWAVHCAKSFSEKDGNSLELTDNQKKILQILKETGGTDSKTLLEQLQIDNSDFEREIATLRHMEKIRGALRQGEKIFRLW